MKRCSTTPTAILRNSVVHVSTSANMVHGMITVPVSWHRSAANRSLQHIPAGNMRLRSGLHQSRTQLTALWAGLLSLSLVQAAVCTHVKYTVGMTQSGVIVYRYYREGGGSCSGRTYVSGQYSLIQRYLCAVVRCEVGVDHHRLHGVSVPATTLLYQIASRRTRQTMSVILHS